MKNKLLILVTGMVFILPAYVFAQYSNATFSGPWIVTVMGQNTYITFDGMGSIDLLGTANAFVYPIGTYSVQSNGSITATLTLTSGVNNITGNATSDSTATIYINSQGPYSEVKVDNPGALADTLTGTLYDSSSQTTMNIKMTVSSIGTAFYAGGDVPGISGKIFAQQGTFAGYVTSTDTTCILKKIQMWGTVTGNVLQGTAKLGNSDTSSCNGTGAVILTRTSAIHAGVSDLAAGANFKVYPNPFNDYFTLTAEGQAKTVEVMVYDVLGRKILGKVFNDSPTMSLSDLNKLSSGVYLLSITSGTQTVTKRIVKE